MPISSEANVGESMNTKKQEIVSIEAMSNGSTRKRPLSNTSTSLNNTNGRPRSRFSSVNKV